VRRIAGDANRGGGMNRTEQNLFDTAAIRLFRSATQAACEIGQGVQRHLRHE
jgi:hypothetical protein